MEVVEIMCRVKRIVIVIPCGAFKRNSQDASPVVILGRLSLALKYFI